MKRGEIWTMAGGSGYAGKPRPAVIIQDDGFAETLSIAVCPLTSAPIDAPSSASRCIQHQRTACAKPAA